MKTNQKIYALALGALMGGMFASCSNELNEPGYNQQAGTIALAKAPSIYAWVGEEALKGGPAMATRAADGAAYGWDYNFPADMAKAENIVPTGDAYTGENQGDGTYLVTGEHYESPVLDWQGNPQPDWGINPGLKFNDNSHVTVYVASGAVVENIGNNLQSLDLYIAPGAEVTISKTNTMNNCTIYNAGTLNVPNNFEGTRIHTIYNTGNLYIDGQGTWNGNVQQDDGVKIYSKNGYVEYLSSANIDGTIVSDNIVKVDGDIKLQNSKGYRDICKLIANRVDVVEGTNIFGEIEAQNLFFDKGVINLHPQGLINIAQEVNLPNSGNRIYPAEGSIGLVKCNLFSIHLTNLPITTALPEGMYLNANSFYVQNMGRTFNSFSELIDARIADKDNVSPHETVEAMQAFAARVNNASITVNPSCGDAASNEPEEDNCEFCGHPTHEPGNCPDPDCTAEECHPTTPPTEGDDNNEPAKPTVPDGISEVEVNLAINDYDSSRENGVETLMSKLSIHVRAATDVKIRIPIPASAVCAADDLVILEKHEELISIHGGPTTLTYNVGGKDVTLTYEVTESEIIVTTDGIDQDVIDYCVAQHADGINFEIWTYFNDQFFGEISDAEKKAQLKEILDGATIEFLDETPHYYINAFTDHQGENLETDENPGWIWDCQVNIVESQSGAYTRGTGHHLNHSPYNKMWRHSKVEEYLEDGTNEHSHGFLGWGESVDDYRSGAQPTE